MKHLSICILGGTGFLGTRLVARLIKNGHQVTVLSRDREQHKHLLVLPGLTLDNCDVYDEAQLSEQFRAQDAVINLVGILNERGFGELEDKALVLSIIEATYLVETEKMEVIKGDTAVSFEELVKFGSEKEEEFYNKYLVYKDLRERGLLVRSGLKFGTDFRLYDRGEAVGKGHSKYLVHVVPEEYTCSFPEMARALRLAKNVNKDMLYAIVDGECDITYYLVDRMML